MTQFGKNRMQYEKFTWTFYDYGTYKVYFYQGGEGLAKYVGEKVKNCIKNVENRMVAQLHEASFSPHSFGDLCLVNLIKQGPISLAITRYISICPCNL